MALWSRGFSRGSLDLTGTQGSPKLNGTVKIPGKVFENLGIRFECTLFDGISGVIENFVFHSQQASTIVQNLIGIVIGTKM